MALTELGRFVAPVDIPAWHVQAADVGTIVAVLEPAAPVIVVEFWDVEGYTRDLVTFNVAPPLFLL